MLNRRPGRCAGAAIMASNHNVITLGFRNTSGDRAYADLGDQLD